MQLVGARTYSSDCGVSSDDEIFWRGRAREDDGGGGGNTSDNMWVQHDSEEDHDDVVVVMPLELQSWPPPLRSPAATIHPISNSLEESSKFQFF